MLNLSTITVITSATVEIKHPLTKAPLGAFIEIAGPEHPERKKLIFDRQRRLRATFAKKGRIDFADPVADVEEETELLVDCTIGWKGIGDGKTETPFTKAAAREIYTDPKLAWLRDQVKAEMDNQENFIQDSETN
ncbi:MAG: hypothetical protein ABTQ26_00195 [Azonexus sp.]